MIPRDAHYINDLCTQPNLTTKFMINFIVSSFCLLLFDKSFFFYYFAGFFGVFCCSTNFIFWKISIKKFVPPTLWNISTNIEIIGCTSLYFKFFIHTFYTILEKKKNQKILHQSFDTQYLIRIWVDWVRVDRLVWCRIQSQ